MKYSIGIDIGGTKCAVLLGNPGYPGNIETFIVRKETFDTQKAGGPYEIIRKIIDLIYLFFRETGITTTDITGIGISCGGPLDSRKGIIMSPPNLPGWDSIPIKDILEKEFGVPVNLENDANACAMAEWKFGAGKGCQNMVFLTFGTGLGAGLILDGKLYSGTNDNAGEVGHIRLEKFGPVGFGKAGSFEGFCSGGGIAQIARMKVLERVGQGAEQKLCKDIHDVDSLNARDLAIAANNGDELAVDIYKTCGEYLGYGLSIIIDILNPERIVIGSIFERSGNLLWPYALKVLEEECLSASLEVCKVVPAALGDYIGDYAALSLAAGTKGD